MGNKAELFGDRAVAYISCLAIRKDEEIRAERINARIGHSAQYKKRSKALRQPPNESILTPLIDNNVSKKNVIELLGKAGI